MTLGLERFDEIEGVNGPFKVGRDASAVPCDALVDLGKVADVALGTSDPAMVQHLKGVISGTF